MDGNKLRELTESMSAKLGEDKSAMIADDMGLIMTGFENMNNQISERDKRIKELEEDKAKLVASNGNLLRQIPVMKDEEEPEEKDVAKKPFNFKDAFDAKAKETGVTIHYVDEGVDTGEIIHQEKFAIDPSWTLEELEERVHALEYKMYPEVLDRLCKEREN